MRKQIKTIDDVTSFFEHLVFERGLRFHPDTPFSDYVYVSTGNPTFTKDQVVFYEKLLAESFRVCQAYDRNIYSLAIDVMHKISL